jgi:hypothetical protein
MKPRLTAYCFAWHTTVSPAFQHLLGEPLAPFFETEFVALPDFMMDTDDPLPTTQPIVFCQRPPFPAWMADGRAHIVWIPMWDLARIFPQFWWDALPKTVRVIAFSDAVAARAQSAGLPTLRLRYAKNPAEFRAVDWQADRTLMYWNRTGLLSPEALRQLCNVLDIRRLLFRDNLDPYIPRTAAYRLPRRIGTTIIETMPDFMPYGDYLELLAQTQVYIAPRAQEGVGMTFLEAMASGCAVLAADAPTMNEYIAHEQTGILLSFDQDANERNRHLRTFKHQRMSKRWRQRLFGPSFQHPITEVDIPVDTLEQCNLETLGQAGRSSLITAHQRWQDRLAEYAQFVLEW